MNAFSCSVRVYRTFWTSMSPVYLCIFEIEGDGWSHPLCKTWSSVFGVICVDCSPNYRFSIATRHGIVRIYTTRIQRSLRSMFFYPLSPVQYNRAHFASRHIFSPHNRVSRSRRGMLDKCTMKVPSSMSCVSLIQDAILAN